ncbi:PepSY domain-containing protein [Methylocella silvestris]|uniref:PepSY domain-containing protein n=1 Tax=Methylocella silvestris TaxID=199596 RepID=A0A2J7TH03_METSI|nr:PepSY domain-containing protein [Methylocella silvestris]PNG26050.1 hypothetical protein CR492_10685 [Methylocella silvestris]
MNGVILSLGLLVGLCLCVRTQAAPRCYSTGETREKIATDGLTEPFRAMQKAAARTQAEALAAKLCLGDDDFVYEISLLRRDGKIIRAFVNAKSGQMLDAKSEKKRGD